MRLYNQRPYLRCFAWVVVCTLLACCSCIFSSHILQAATQEEKDLKQAIKLKPNDAEAHYRLGLYYQTIGKNELSAKEFRKALKISPDYAESYFALGISLAHLGEYMQAIENYKKAVEYNSKYCAQAFNGIGSAYRDLHQKDYLKEALDNFIRASDNCADKDGQLFVINIQNIVTTYMALYTQTAADQNGKDYLVQAIRYAQKASSIEYKEKYSKNYAMIQYCLGELYSQLQGNQNTIKAESAYNEALAVFNRSQYPDEHQMVFDSIQLLKQNQNHNELIVSENSWQTDEIKQGRIIQLVGENNEPLRGAMVSLYEKKDGEFVKAYFRDKTIDNLGQLEVSSTLLNLPKSSEFFIHTQDGFYWQTVKIEGLKFTGQRARIVLSKTGIISATLSGPLCQDNTVLRLRG